MIDKNLPNELREWRLQCNRGIRARLRRYTTPLEVMLDPEFHCVSVNRSVDHQTKAMSLGLLAHVKEDMRKGTFAELLAPDDKQGRKGYSRMRFRKLITCTDAEEFYRQMRRAIAFVDGRVPIRDLVKSIQLWQRDRDNQRNSSIAPVERFAFVWANDFYANTIKVTEQETPNEDHITETA